MGRRCAPQACPPYACNQETGHCRTWCRDTADCVEGFLCERGFCVGTQCAAGTAAAVCGGYWCVGGICSTDCTSAACAPGFYCRGDTRRCEPRCTTRDDPACAGFVCDVLVGECEPYCLDGELACASGFRCTPDQRCEPLPDGG